MLDFVYFMMTVKDPSKEEDMFTLVAVIGIYWEIFVVFQLSVIVYLFFAFFGKEEKYVEQEDKSPMEMGDNECCTPDDLQ